MLNGVFALLERSLRVDSRALPPHLARVGLIGAIYLSIWWTLAIQFSIGAPGLQFLSMIAWLDAIFMTLVGISFFSTVITEEKEEDTLGLMMMAGISPLGILAGKSGGRLCQALLLIAVQYPFMLLAVTMGGVMTGQIWSLTIALLAYMVFLAGFGLLCSTVAQNSKSAGIWMTLGVIAYIGVPSFVKILVQSHKQGNQDWTTQLNLSPGGWSVIDASGDLCVFFRMNEILASGYNESAFSGQVISNVIVGFVCAGLAWLLFDIATRNPSTEPVSRGGVAQRRGFLRFTAGRVWVNPFVWKDFHFVSGGVTRLAIRFAYYIGLGLIAFFFASLFNMGEDAWVPLFLVWIMLSLPVDAALLVSRSMQEEVRGQTLSSLLMLPRSSNGIVYSKLGGAMLGWFPGPVIGIATLVGTDSGQKGLMSIDHDALWYIPLIALYFSFVPHFAALLGLYVRWGAVPLAIGMTLGVYFALMMLAMLVVMASLYSGLSGLGSNISPYAFVPVIYGVFLGIIGATHFGILLRFQSLGEK